MAYQFLSTILGSNANFTGNVGVGTTTPGAKVDIQSTSGNNLRLSYNSSYYWQLSREASDGRLSFIDGIGGERFTILTTGNVGIGTSNPTRTLHVLGQSGIGTVLKLEGAAGTTTYLQLSYNGASNAQSGYIGYDTSSNMSFFTNDTERMRITSGGNVGIGTSNPISLLNLNNGDAWINVVSQLRGLQFGYAGPTHGSYRAAVMGGPEVYGASDSGMLTFHTQDGYVISAVPPERMRITGGGNVLIGITTNNGTKLRVNGVTESASFIDSSLSRIKSPGGGYLTTGGGQTGAIKIKLPVLGSFTMMYFTVKIYQYSTGQSYELQIGGYNYGYLSSYWYNVFATNLTDAGSSLNVRWGNDGSNDCIWIGETSSSWAYPQVWVTDFQAGFGGFGINFADGWNISFVTTFDTVQVTRTAAQVITSNNISSYGITGSGTTNYLPKFTGSTSVGNSNIYDNGGNIGIGLTNADYPLTVDSINVGGAGANLGIILNSVINSAIPSSSVKAVIGVANSGYGYSSGSLLIQPRTGVGAVTAFATEGVEKMRIDASGNVGIGTTSGFNSISGTETTLSIASTNIASIYLNSTSAGNKYALYSSAGGTFQIYNITQGTYPFAVANSGNVLIGTTTDAGYKLDVNGTGRFSGSLQVGQGSGGSGTATQSVFQDTYGGRRSTIYVKNTADYAVGRGSGYGFLNGNGTEVSSIQIAANDASQTSYDLYVFLGGVQRLGIGSSGAITITNLSGSGTRMVVADSAGTLSTQSIPTGTVTGSGTTNYVSKWSSSSSLTNSLLYDNGTYIGLGTTSPSEKLDINGNAQIESNIYLGHTGANNQIRTREVNQTLDIGTTLYLTFSTYNGSWGERIRLANSGNLLIGTTTDSGYRLQVEGGMSISGNIVQNGNSTYAIYIPSPTSNFGPGKVYLRLAPSSSSLITTLRITITSTWYWAPGFGNITADYSFYNSGGTLNFANRTVTTANGKAAENLRLGELEFESGYLSIPIYSINTNPIYVKIEGAGGLNPGTVAYSSWVNDTFPAENTVYVQTKLGVGVTNPSAKLEVNGDASLGAAYLSNTDSTFNSTYFTVNSSYLTLGNNTADVVGISNNTMYFPGSGNVGIGTTNPASKLVISNNGAEGIEFGYSSYLSSNYLESINRSTGNPVDFSYYLGSGASHKFYTSGLERMRIVSGGNVLIGTTTDNGYRLQVAGDTTMSGTLTINSTVNNGFNLDVEGSASFLDTVVQNYPTNSNALGGITSYQSQDNLTYNFVNNTYSGETISGIAATNIFAGQIVVMRNGGLTWDLADASVSGPLAYNMIGIACRDAHVGDTFNILLRGFYASNSWYSSSPQYGAPMYLSPNTAGTAEDTIPSTTGNVVRIVGHIDNYSNNNGVFVLRFNPDNFWLVI